MSTQESRHDDLADACPEGHIPDALKHNSLRLTRARTLWPMLP